MLQYCVFLPKRFLILTQSLEVIPTNDRKFHDRQADRQVL
jgi:hypothetical protein